MDFELSADQEALRAAARELLTKQAAPALARAAMDRGGEADAGLWSSMVDQGWCGIVVPEAEGGVGLGWVEAAIVLEQVGSHVAPVPILGQLVALEFLAGTEWGPGLLDGSQVGAIAPRLGEPTVYAPSADVVVVPEGDRLVAIDLREHRPAAEPAMDLTRTLGWLSVDALSGAPRVDVGGARRAGTPRRSGRGVLQRGAARHRDSAASTCRWPTRKERVQFGRPIGSFQAVKHRCADMLVDVEGMRSAVYWAAWCVSVGHEDASVAASTAKCWCSDAANRVTASALQVHGGIGFTWEHDIHLYLKRAHLDALSFGDATAHRVRLTRLLRARIEAGESVI